MVVPVIPVISDLPPAPTRSDGPADFTPKADTMIGALQPMVVQINIALQWMNGRLTDTQAAQAAAAASAEAAAQSAVSANTSKLAAQQAVTDAGEAGAQQVELAVSAKVSAEAAAAAAQAAAGLPSVADKAFMALRVNAAGTGVEWAPGVPNVLVGKTGQSVMLGADKAPYWGWAGDQVGDMKSMARIPGADYLPAAGGIYLKSAYPALAAVLGNIGDPAGLNWTNTGQPSTNSSGDGIATDGKGMWIKGNKRSTDNGVTWVTMTPAFNMHKAATDGSGVWIATVADGATFRSTDNGATWAVVGGTTAQMGQITNGIDTNKAGVWVMTGYNGKTIRSTDNGVTWTQLSPVWGGSTAGAVRWLSGATWLTSSNHRSTDNGATWAVFAAVDYPGSFDRSLEKTPSGFLVKGINGNVKISKDSGVTWKTVTTVSEATTSQKGIACDANGVIVATGGGTTTSISANEGETWQALVLPGAGGAIAAGSGKFITNSATGPGFSLQSVETFYYDTTTQFKLPSPIPIKGVRHYIKALEAA